MLSFYQACQTILENRNIAAVKGAVDFARAGLAMNAVSREAKMQSLLMLNHIAAWTGGTAETVRTALTAHSKS